MDTTCTTKTTVSPPTQGAQASRTTLESALCPLEIVRKMGQGGAGDIYEVADNTSGAHYVVKTLRPGVQTAVDVIRFRREAQFMAKLHHPNLMPVIRVRLDADPPYYMMPLREG